MYEMLLGQSPFRGDDEDEIFDAILEDEPLYPITMPRDAVAILQKLLTRDPQRRLGSGPTDAEEIKKQPFFKDVVWDDVFNKRIPAPYQPTIVSERTSRLCQITHSLANRKEKRTRVISMRSLRKSSPRSRLYTVNSRRAIKPSSMASHGCVSLSCNVALRC
jgi:serine/threonine protein kinase